MRAWLCTIRVRTSSSRSPPPTGDGVFEAAKENGFYAIGVDSDQKYIDPEVIICSMKKEVGSSIYDAVKSYLAGDSRFGTTWTADMATGYVGIGYGDSGMTQQVPDEVEAAVEELAAKIASGRDRRGDDARVISCASLAARQKPRRFLYSKESEVTSLAGKCSRIPPYLHGVPRRARQR